MTLARYLALTLALLASPFGAAQAQDENQATVDTEAVESSYLLVEVIRPAKFVGFPKVCPGTSPEDNQDEIFCMAEMYEVPVRVIDHLGGPTTNRRLNIRFTAHSFYIVWQRNRRFLLKAWPFEDKGRTGHFAGYWDWENEDQEFCVEESSVESAAQPFREFYKNGRTIVIDEDNEDWSEGSKIRCVRGRLGLER